MRTFDVALLKKAPDYAGAFSSSEKKSGQYFALKMPGLLLAVLFRVGLCCFFRVMPTMNRVCSGRVRVMCRLLVMSAFMMFGRFTVVPGGMSMMFRCLMMMFRSFLRHLLPPNWISRFSDSRDSSLQLNIDRKHSFRAMMSHVLLLPLLALSGRRREALARPLSG
jgi:hypothetical protein